MAASTYALTRTFVHPITGVEIGLKEAEKNLHKVLCIRQQVLGQYEKFVHHGPDFDYTLSRCQVTWERDDGGGWGDGDGDDVGVMVVMKREYQSNETDCREWAF